MGQPLTILELCSTYIRISQRHKQHVLVHAYIQWGREIRASAIGRRRLDLSALCVHSPSCAYMGGLACAMLSCTATNLLEGMNCMQSGYYHCYEQFIHVCCLATSNKHVHSSCTCKPHAVLAVHRNYFAGSS